MGAPRGLACNPIQARRMASSAWRDVAGSHSCPNPGRLEWTIQAGWHPSAEQTVPCWTAPNRCSTPGWLGSLAQRQCSMSALPPLPAVERRSRSSQRFAKIGSSAAYDGFMAGMDCPLTLRCLCTAAQRHFRPGAGRVGGCRLPGAGGPSVLLRCIAQVTLCMICCAPRCSAHG